MSRSSAPLPFWLLIAVLGAVLLGAVLWAPTVGPTELSLARALDSSIPAETNTDRIVLFELRLPRVALALAVGVALALAGAAFQALLRNDLATPYTLGVSGGASLGALLVLQAAGGAGAGAAVLYGLVPLAAFAGGAAAAATVLVLAARSRGPGSERGASLILAGVTLNLLFGAAVMILQYRSDPYEVAGMIRWLMGSLDATDFTAAAVVGGGAVLVGAILMASAMALNVMTLGDATAAHLGFHPGRVRALCLMAGALGAALCVAYAGPVGFVGLIIPHMMRRFTGPDHRRLLPACALAGAAFLVLCDAVGRLLGGNTEIPVGIVTAVLGGPFFLWLLFRRG
ncbi:MAG: iron ABC transporter permease [Sumerlaeia bacterium]